MTASVIVAIVSCCIALCSVIFAAITISRNGKKDVIADAKEQATINVKLDNISNVVTDIKYDISATKKEIAEMSKRLQDAELQIAKVEESTKSAHKRIDSVEERIER